MCDDCAEVSDTEKKRRKREKFKPDWKWFPGLIVKVAGSQFVLVGFQTKADQLFSFFPLRQDGKVECIFSQKTKRAKKAGMGVLIA